MISYLMNPLLSAVIAGILSMLFYKLDSKITKTPKSKLEYLKSFLISAIVTGLIVFILSFDSPSPLPNVKLPTSTITSELPDF